MPLLRLYLNHIADRDQLMALEFGRAYDDQPPGNWQSVGEDFGLLRDGPAGPIVGFGVDGFGKFDVDDRQLAEVWTAVEFEVPCSGCQARALPRSSLPLDRSWAIKARSTAGSSPRRSTPSAQLLSRRSGCGSRASKQATRWPTLHWDVV